MLISEEALNRVVNNHYKVRCEELEALLVAIDDEAYRISGVSCGARRILRLIREHRERKQV